jgi:prepilin-type N-terminal cleavage/methylation domain-containing protein/prepilin-type processing-associated H-X9-DG protein
MNRVAARDQNCRERGVVDGVHDKVRGQDDGEGKGAFTLLELLAVIAIVGILAGILLPALAQGKASARRAQCTDQLRQMGLATQLYWEEHDDFTFRYLAGATNGGRLYWFGWLKPGSEGDREFDATEGVLHPYLRAPSLLICPSLNYQATRHKLKARAAACNYGYNRYLGKAPMAVSRIKSPVDTVLFADAAQVNDFQAPASVENPLLEEFYYVDADEGSGYPNVHFRHNNRAQAVFVDGHVALLRPVPDSWDLRLPAHAVGRLPRTMLQPQ